MTDTCADCRVDISECYRCDRDRRLRDLDGHESRHGLYHLLGADGGQNHE